MRKNRHPIEYRLLNLKDLADVLDVPYTYVSAMKRAGMLMIGGRITIQEALEWRRNNPDFQVTRALESPRVGRGDPELSSVGKRDGS